MKRTALFPVLALTMAFAMNAKARDADKCTNVVKHFMTAVSNHSTEGLDAYLAPDFTMAGQQQPIAAMVLAQLIPQLNETVESYELTEQQAANGILTLK